ncbi:MAG: CpsD/CapB family tyrosine-protein kinase, partial [Nitrospirota bacterium]
MIIKSIKEKIGNLQDAFKKEDIPPYEKSILSGNVQSVITEQYRLLRSKLSSLNGSHTNNVLAITSARKGEGKSLTSVNLAIVMAEDTKKKILLIDGDMRKPSIHTFFNCKAEYGLIDLLMHKVDIESAMIPSGIKNLTLLLAGEPSKSPSDLLAAAVFREIIEKIRKRFDYIIIDSPPIMPFADMNIISDVVDGILLVVRAEKTPKEMILEALKTLNKENVIGVVFNDSKKKMAKIYY